MIDVRHREAGGGQRAGKHEPYGQSVFADAIDAVQAVDLAFDAMISEVDNGKMRVFLSEVMFDQEIDGKGRKVSIPFDKTDCTVFRKVMSTKDTIQEFAPALRTDAQAKAQRTAMQMLGDLTGFGINYFDFDAAGYVKTATEVSADNSAPMRNIRRDTSMRWRTPSPASAARCWRWSGSSACRLSARARCA